MTNHLPPVPALLVGDLVRITAEGYPDLKGFLVSIQLGEGLEREYYLESPFRDCLIGPLGRSELAPVMTCEWFVTCANEALTAVTHPVLGDVPVCDSCLRLAAPDPATS